MTQEELEAVLAACEQQRVDADDTQDPSDFAYNCAVTDCMDAVIALRLAAPVAPVQGEGEFRYWSREQLLEYIEWLRKPQPAQGERQPEWCPNPEPEVPVGELIATETSTRVSVIGHYIAPGTYPLYLGAKK